MPADLPCCRIILEPLPLPGLFAVRAFAIDPTHRAFSPPVVILGLGFSLLGRAFDPVTGKLVGMGWDEESRAAYKN